MKHFIVYNKSTGEVVRSGVCQDADIQSQAIYSDEVVMEATGDAIRVAEVDLGPVKQAAINSVNAEAARQREAHFPSDAGMASVYAKKEAEARAYLADNQSLTPMLSAEADGLGIELAVLVAEVIAAADAWFATATAIEVKRRTAIQAINGAENVAEIHTSSQVDWSAAS